MKSLFNCIFPLAFFPLAVLTAQQKGQKVIDSLIEVTQKSENDTARIAAFGTLFEILQFRQPSKAFEYAQKEYGLAEKINYKKGIASSQLHFADYYKKLGRLDSARYYFEKSSHQFKAINNLRGELFVNHSRAIFEQSLGNFDKAIQYAQRNIEIYNQRDSLAHGFYKEFNLIGSEYELIGGIHLDMGNYKLASIESFKAVRFFENIKDTIRMGDALLQLGNINLKQNEFEASIENTRNAHTIYHDFEDKEYAAYASIQLGQGLLGLNQTAEAQSYFQKALELAKDLKNSEIQADALFHLGSVQLKLSNFANAQKLTNEGMEIHEELGYKKSIATDLNQLAEISLKIGRESQAIRYLNTSLEIASNIDSKDAKSKAFLLRSIAYRNQDNFKNALFDFETYKLITDSIFSVTKSRQIEELRAIYQTEKKEQQIAIQQNEIALLEQEAKINNLQRLLLGGGLIFSLLVFGFGYYGIRQKMKRNKLEKEKVDAELAFKKKELTTHALHLAKKNEVLESLKQKAQELKENEASKKGYQQLIRTINFDLQDDNNWENFSRYFEEVHKDFNSTVKTKYPQVSSNELRLLALLKMNLSSKEIANILNISPEGVKKARYRLRKKLNITTEDSLQDLVFSL